MSGNINDLFSSAVQNNDLDQQAAMVLVENLDAVALAGCNGVGLDQIDSDDVTLVAVVLDESGSMSPYRQSVIEGFNQMLEALRESRMPESILLSTWAFSANPRLLFSYTPVTGLNGISEADFNPDSNTALYDTLLHVMTGMVAYGQMLRDNGVRTRGIIVVFSDGEDNTSKATNQQVLTVSNALVAQESYTLAYVGFGNLDLNQIAQEVGFPAVLTVQASASEIRRIFHQVSASIIRSQTTIGANRFFI
ncbi:VWA domain-containing protein [Candidatus Chlorohelix sp.]|uniref:vWA domain-containing protein n=1 Tax=Candidatus Chlorohelix sp. TaxID=3139201 RepID=UPI003052666B